VSGQLHETDGLYNFDQMFTVKAQITTGRLRRNVSALFKRAIQNQILFLFRQAAAKLAPIVVRVVLITSDPLVAGQLSGPGALRICAIPCFHAF
jgi:hypothetical protein